VKESHYLPITYCAHEIRSKNHNWETFCCYQIISSNDDAAHLHVNGLDSQPFAGSSKIAPRILISSIAMGADQPSITTQLFRAIELKLSMNPGHYVKFTLSETDPFQTDSFWTQTISVFFYRQNICSALRKNLAIDSLYERPITCCS